MTKTIDRSFKKVDTVSTFKKIDESEANRLHDLVGNNSNQMSVKVEPAQLSPKIKYAVGQTYDVPISLIKRNPYNPRPLVSASSIEEMSLSLQKDGQDTPVPVFIRNSDEEHVYLIDGHRRLMGASLANLQTLKVIIQDEPIDAQSLYIKARRTNVEREDQSPINDAIAWKILLDEGVFTNQEELSQKLGIDKTVVSRTLNIADINKQILNLLIERPSLLNLRMLDAIRKFQAVAGNDATEDLIIEIDKSDLSSRQVDAKRIAFENGPSKRVRGQNLPRVFARGKTLCKRFDEQGKIIFEITELKQIDDLNEINEKISKLLEDILNKNK